MNQTIKLHSAIAFLVLWLCIASTPAGAQSVQNLKFKHYSYEKGLSQGSAQCVIQDNLGFIWVGTQEGLNRFDGNSFKVFRNDPLDSTSISDSYIFCIYEDHQGRIWVGTRGGLNLFNPVTENFIRYVKNPNNPSSLINNDVRAILQDRKGELWIGTSGGLDLFTPEKSDFKHFVSQPSDTTSLSDNRTTTIYQDEQGFLWVGTLNGLNLMNSDGLTFTRLLHNPAGKNIIGYNHIRDILQSGDLIFVASLGGGLNLINRKTKKTMRFLHNPYDQKSISHNDVYSILLDPQGKIWVGTGHGLNILDTLSFTFTRYYHNPAVPSSLGNDFILDLFRDAHGYIWIATFGRGVAFVDTQTSVFSHFYHEPTNPASLSDNIIWGLCRDRNDRIWIGTSNGLNLSNNHGESFERYFHNALDPYSLSHNLVRYIYQDKQNRVWVGTRSGLNLWNEKTKKFKRFQNNPRNSNTISEGEIKCIFQDSENRIWIGTKEGGLNLFNPEKEVFSHFRHDPNNPNSLSSNWVNDVKEDHEGRIWVATADGLNLFNAQTSTFKSYRHEKNNSSSLSHNSVMVVFEDSKNRLWVTTSGGGLNLFHPESGTFTSWKKNNGLASNFVVGALEDSHGNLWLSTAWGIIRFNPETEKIDWYDESDGLQSNDFDHHSFLKGKGDKIYFGGINGVSVFHPDSIKANTIIPPVVITGFQLFNKPVAISDTTVLKKSLAYTQEIILTHQENVFAFEFSALNYRQPEKNQFAYKLEPFNKDWIYTNYKDRKAVFTNIPPGEYVFRVKASNDDGYWNEEGTSINVIILPPWWLTWWAKIIWAGVIIGIPFTFYKIRTSTLKAQRKKLQVQVAEQTSELQKRLQEKKILYELSSHLIGRLGLDEVLKNIIDAAISIAPNAQGSSIFLLNQDENVLEGKISHRLPADQFQKVKFKVGEGLGGRAVAENRSFIENYVQDDKLFTLQLENDNITPLKSIIVVLLKNKDKTIGTISLDNYENHGAFTQTDFTMLSSLAANASLAIERVRMAKEIEDQNENLNKAYTQLKELDQYKESMTAMIVHDFKNSLNTVISFSEGTPTERRLRSIRQAGQFMLNMVMNILDLQKFESASVKLSLANYTVNKLINEAVDQLSYLIEQKAINLTCEPAGLYCRVDHDLTVRVIVNILSNAIKYVPQNGKIDILATRQNDFVRIAIRDNGIGIPADKIHLVFEKYVQINAQKSGSVRSTGIGLTFCKMVVENLGGSIGAESEESKGSTFYFTLPFVNEDLSQAQPSEPLVFLQEQDVVLSDEEHDALKHWLEKLRQWEVYDYSEVTAIIEKIENGNGNIASWKEQVMKAMQTGNEGQFSKLINK